jgi:RimJ/RimL family protein N-acetyltransferase
MFTKDDLDDYASMCADPEVMRYLGDGKAMSRTDTWRVIAMILGAWQLRGYGLWAVEDRVTRQFVGRVGFIHPEGWPGIELGWMLARPFWGRGLATEAGQVCLNYGFESFGFTRIISCIHPENHRSIAVAKRLGEKQEGTTEMFGKPALIYAIRKGALTAESSQAA